MQIDNGHNTGTSRFSSCAEAAAVSEAKIGTAKLELYASLRHAATKGWSTEALASMGLQVPKPDKPKRVYTHKFTEGERRAKVEAIHELRRNGVKAKQAAKQGGDIVHQTYAKWCDDLDMPYTGRTLRDAELS